ncbi:monovalent cation/H+ antiporter subunit D [Luteimonas sp. e5]
MNHLLIAPILIPLLCGALLLLLERRHDARVLRIGAWVGMAALLLASLALLRQTLDGSIGVYLVGDWPSRLGITLVGDRLGSTLVLTTCLLAIPCLLHAGAGWDMRAPHFHPLFQFQLAGLNGAFLTGDLFNLFVFFEVLLIASYGLLLSGARGLRIKAGLHYVVFNIAASTLFLIALGLLYGMLGTLNMAEMAARIGQVPAADQALLRASGGLVLVVFCAKAALLPMYTWLPETYSRAPAVVAALFAIMTKVGLYAVLRVGALMFGAAAGALDGLAWDWLLPAGILTVVLASLGVVGATLLRIGVAYLVLLSAGTLFIAFALHTPATIGAGLYYLPHSAFAAAALFLIAELIQRVRGDSGDDLLHRGPIAAKPVLGTLYLLAGVALVGLPPLSGFIGKLALLQATPDGMQGWVWAAVLGSSLLTLVGVTRIGTRVFWRVEPRPTTAAPPPLPRRVELAAIFILMLYVFAMSLAAEPLLRHARATASQTLDAEAYIHAIGSARPLIREPSP